MAETLSGYCAAAAGHPFHGPYHDHEYGFPLENDDDLFGRLILEINQAGLSWLTILKKKARFREAYSGFSIPAVAAYGEADHARLLADAGIIRNRLKVRAAIQNARRILKLQEDFGSFKAWLDSSHPLDKEGWVRLFKRTFFFTGGEITNEFLVSTGYMPGAHDPRCPVFEKIVSLEPPWMKQNR